MFYAHMISNDDKQTVNNHLLSTAHFCEMFGSKINFSKTLRLIALLHDMGKMSKKYQQYLDYSFNHPNDRSLRGTVIHASQGSKYIMDKISNSVDYEDRMLFEIISIIIASHHGGLIDGLTIDGENILQKKLIQPRSDLYYDEVFENFKSEVDIYNEVELLLPQAKHELIMFKNRAKENKEWNGFTRHMLIKYLFSCLIDADRYDTYLYMSKSKPVKVIPPWKDMIRNLDIYITKLNKNNEINRLRSDISDQCFAFAKRPSGVYRLSVPTGAGKTLASIRYALKHADEYKKDRIIHIIPYISIIDQNAEILKDALLLKEHILEFHSNVINETVIKEELEHYELLIERFDASVILTTMVQFLNILYKGGTKNIRKLHTFTNSVIIFDEIQSIPVNCINLFNSAVNFLSTYCNATIILCTATQPRLFDAPKKLKLSENPEMVNDIDKVFRSFKRTNIINSMKQGGYKVDELSTFVLDKFSDIDNLLVILNTKKNAKELFDALAERTKLSDKNYKLYFMTTDMCPRHRKEVLDEINKNLNKYPLICVSTSVIEAGINISFECVVRALAGMDSILQAAGRCNRNNESSVRNVYIVNPDNEKLQSLPTIAEGKKASERVLREMGKEGYDLLSPDCIDLYYRYYYEQIINSMDYHMKVNDIEVTANNLLSKNVIGVSRADRDKTPVLVQAFESVGKHFKVIDDNTVTVIVPYKEGEGIIKKLRKDMGIAERKSLIKEAGQYSINVFDHVFKLLKKEQALEELPFAMYALRSLNYDIKTGLIITGKMEFMNY